MGCSSQACSKHVVVEGTCMRHTQSKMMGSLVPSAERAPSQANILVLAFVKDGQFITTGEKVILPIFLVFSLFTSLLGAIAVRDSSCQS